MLKMHISARTRYLVLHTSRPRRFYYFVVFTQKYRQKGSKTPTWTHEIFSGCWCTFKSSILQLNSSFSRTNCEMINLEVCENRQYVVCCSESMSVVPRCLHCFVVHIPTKIADYLLQYQLNTVWAEAAPDRADWVSNQVQQIMASIRWLQIVAFWT